MKKARDDADPSRLNKKAKKKAIDDESPYGNMNIHKGRLARCLKTSKHIDGRWDIKAALHVVSSANSAAKWCPSLSETFEKRFWHSAI